MKFKTSKSSTLNFTEKVDKYKNLIQRKANVAIWGAGAKGSMFLNLLDKECEIVKNVVDINPKKQNKHIGGTGHKIISPEDIAAYRIENIVVMNENYYDEIEKKVKGINVNLFKL